jgi:peptidoglycan biosynthesis protein MviN/MurJ (putative lipid II flippase)
MVLVALASVVATASPVVDQFMAATLGEGRVATLGYANRIVSVVLVVIATGVGTVLLPRFSTAAVGSGGGELRMVFRRSTKMALGVACVVAVALVALADPLVRTLLQGGELTAGDADVIVDVLRLYALQVPFYVFGVIGARLLNALERNSWLVVMGLANLVVNVGLNLLLMSRYGVRGIAAGTSAVYALSSLVMAFATQEALRRSDARLAETTA